jgi:hypothetical protein
MAERRPRPEPGPAGQVRRDRRRQRVLANHAGLDPGQLLRYEFTLPVAPRLQAPTIRAPAYTLTWMLRGVVDRQLRRDPCVAVELHAVTTPA